MKLYKVLNADGTPCHGGHGAYFMPKGKRPGKWMPNVNPRLCESGYHLIDEAHIICWLPRPGVIVCEAEGRGKSCGPDYEGKTAFESVRIIRVVGELTPTVDALLACDIAESALPAFEKCHPDDDRPRRCIEVSRRHALGEATDAELLAAWSAARSAAGSAAWSAAGSAAGSAARSAVWSAAWSAAWSAHSRMLLDRLDAR